VRGLKKFKIYEGKSNLTDSDQRRLDLIEKNRDTFISQFKEMSNKGKAQNFIDHYNILMYIQEEPDLMASILLPLLGNKEFTEWISTNAESFPDTFKESIGVASDLKNLGF
jgi:hypothetical protein